jgi:hypothetical protein
VRNALRLIRNFFAALKGSRDDTMPSPLKRRPVDELLNIGYAHAHGPHSVKDLPTAAKDAA